MKINSSLTLGTLETETNALLVTGGTIATKLTETESAR